MFEEKATTAASLLCYVDVDNAAMSAICKKHGVRAMPTLVYIKGGEEVDKMEGVDMGKYESWASAA